MKSKPEWKKKKTKPNRNQNQQKPPHTNALHHALNRVASIHTLETWLPMVCLINRIQWCLEKEVQLCAFEYLDQTKMVVLLCKAFMAIHFSYLLIQHFENLPPSKAVVKTNTQKKPLNQKTFGNKTWKLLSSSCYFTSFFILICYLMS